MATEEELLDGRYLEWLYNQVGFAYITRKNTSHYSLMSQLYKKPFEWYVHNDDNRMMDGIDLRYEFLDAEGEIADDLWLALGCSMLEMLVALARNAAFEDERTPNAWFWEMMDNLHLRIFVDAKYNDEAHMEINEALDRINTRDYDADGSGGLFPLRNPERDQRDVELWYQLGAYILEGRYLRSIMTDSHGRYAGM